VSYRVIQWATGGVGRAAMEGILEHPDLELAGAWVHNPDKEGSPRAARLLQALADRVQPIGSLGVGPTGQMGVARRVHHHQNSGAGHPSEDRPSWRRAWGPVGQ
jgi:hypothetical protein